ncbi:hypothetical protein PAMP_018030 [Pampus punctatissimus]
MADVNIAGQSAGCSVQFVSWNVKSLNHPVKRKKVLVHLNNLKTDIAFLQETHLRVADHCRLRGDWIGQTYHSNFNSKTRGVAIVINKRIPFIMSKVESDPAGRYVIVVGHLYGLPVILVNIYGPNWEDAGFFSNIFSQLPNMDSHHIILGGDMNCVLSPVLDRSSPKVVGDSKSAQTIKAFLQTSGIADVWRFRNPTAKGYSFFSPVHKSFSRIDYFFIDKKLLPNITDCEYQPIVISDHGPLTMTLCIPGVTPSHRPWRLNPLLLSDDNFVTFIRSEIEFFLAQNQTPGVSYSLIWESLKAYLRGQVISYCAKQRKVRMSRLMQLTNDILRLDRLYCVSPSDVLHKQRLTLKMEFDLLSTYQAENLVLKSRHKYYEHGERAGKVLAHQLRQRTANKFISEITDEENIKHTDHAEINLCFHNYYSHLYTSESLKDKSLLDSFFQNLEVPQLKPELVTKIEEDISTVELVAAIKSMQNGKSPGPDGFPSEFFKTFSGSLAPLLLSVFNESLSTGSLPPTMCEATISLILKSDKNPSHCSSYRPISLLNTDIKILTKLLARRLEQALPSIIAPDQTGFMKNRYSFFNLRRLFNILYNPSTSDTPEIVLSLDAEKAFDRVEWDYLFSTLTKFGFGQKFLSWVKILYSSPMAAVRTNSNISALFNLQRGTRQGCPLSPLLFALAIEPLALAIRKDINIEGIIRGDLECKISLYADDLLLYIRNPLDSLPHILDTLDTFGRISGYKINLQKSELMPINPAARSISFSSTPFKINIRKFKYLGIWITPNYKDLYKYNFLPLIERLKQDIRVWDLLPLSLSGRINTIKMIFLPRLLYLFQNIPIYLTKFFFQSIDNIISTFIWNKKPPRIRRSILQRPRFQGGLALPHFMNYYWSANSRALHYWMLDEDLPDTPFWLNLERATCNSTSLSALLCCELPLLKPTSYYTHNPVVLHSIKIWNQLRRSFGIRSLCFLAPIAKNHMFTPSILDSAFQVWVKRGISKLQDLYVNNHFASFETLVNRYNIPRSHFYRYLQLRNFVASHCQDFPSRPPGSLLDCILKCDSKQAIRKIYKILNSHNSAPLEQLKARWEEDLQEQIPDATWEKIIHRIYTSSICQRHTVIQFKIVHRLHWSKVRLSRIKPDVDPVCDRCKQDPADLLHMFWACPKLSSFWHQIFGAFSEMLKVSVDASPLTALFGVLPQNTKINKQHRNMLAFCTLLARRLILTRWKDSQPPAYSHWIREVMTYVKLEKIRYSIQGSIKKFYVFWQPFLTFIGNVEAKKLRQ